MVNFVVIFLCLIAGGVCKHIRAFPATTHQALNAFVIYVSLPALILAQIPRLLSTMSFEGLWWIPVSMAWIAFALSYSVFSFLGHKLHWSRAKTGALILTAGLGNTSFVGFPMLEALIGPKAVAVGILVDQPGTFLVLSTLGILVAAFYSGAQVSASVLAGKVFKFPPFLALIAAVVWFAAGSRGLESATLVFEKLSSTLVPLALFAVGFQLKFDWNSLKRRWLALVAGLGFKLALTPMIFVLLYIYVLGARDFASRVTVLESAMAPMITSAVVAAEFHLDSEMANLMVGIGIPLSLLTATLWSSFLF